MVHENAISRVVLSCAIEVHRTLGGPGLLETIYEDALVYELEERGLDVRRQVGVPVIYKGRRLGNDLRVDLVVESRVVVECKAAIDDHPVHKAQALTYLRLMSLKLALVINFGRPLVKDGFSRVVNRL